MRVASITKTIAPENKFYMVGYLSKERELPALGLHDVPLCVGIMIEVDDHKLLLVSLDVCVVEKEQVDQMKDEIQKAISIARENIVISSVHTHSASSGLGGADMAVQDNPNYLEFVKKKISECAKELQQSLTPALAYVGRTFIHGFYGNRNDDSKPYDDEALIIKFLNEDQRVVAAICNFNCHSTVVGPQNRYGTSDLIGEVRKNLSGLLGITPYTVPGACADVSNRKFREGNDFKELERVGKGITDQLEDIKFRRIDLESFHTETFTYHVNYDNTRYYNEYKEELSQTNRQLKTDLSVDGQKLLVAQKKMLMDKLAQQKVQFDVVCKLIKLGDLQLITYPGELAAKFGIELKKKSSKPITLIVAYADDYKGYFVEADDFGKCYEAITTRVPKGVAEKIINEIEGKL